MGPNEFFSGRIPKGLLDAIEEYRQNTGESKTQVLINALSTYVNYSLPVSSLPNSPPNSWVDEKFNVLEQRIEALSHLATEVAELKRQIEIIAPRVDNKSDIRTDNAVVNKEQLSLLENSDNEIDNDNKKDTNNKPDNEIDNGSKEDGDNKTDNSDNKPVVKDAESSEESSLTDLPEGIWEDLGEMYSPDILKLQELQNVEAERLKNKVRNTNIAKNKEALVEPCFWRIVRKEPGAKGRLVYRVFRRKP